jgi:peptide-methionine (S)-S-oxide reductase
MATKELSMPVTRIALALAALLLSTGSGRTAETESAIFAGGCFWCVEEAFDAVPGVVATTSGYTGGTVEDPTYQQVSAGGTGHYEAVKVEYDPSRVEYAQLLDTFWRNVDPFDPAGQFCDKGDSYLSAIFVATEEEQRLAEATKADVAERFDMEIATAVLPEQAFYPAEDYHQDFYKTNPARYKYYKWGCGRAQRLEEIWGKPGA